MKLYNKKLPLALIEICLVYTIISGETIPIPDTAPPSRPPTDIGSDYGNDGCSDWRLHHQCHYRPGYPGQYGGSYLFVDLFCASVPPCPWNPSDYQDFYALGIGTQPDLAAPHTPLPSYGWIARCPFEGGRNRGKKTVTSTSVWITWRVEDRSLDDDRDGKRDVMIYEYKDGTLKITHHEFQNGRKVHVCLVYQGSPFPTPHQIPGPPH